MLYQLTERFEGQFTDLIVVSNVIYMGAVRC